MTSALAWLHPRELAPLTAVPSDAPWLSDCRYEGLVAPTVDDEAATVDLLTGADGRAGTLAARVPPGAAVARLTAAWVHTGHRYGRRLTILIPLQGPRYRDHAVVHRQVIGPDDVTHLAGVAVTTPLRTAVDLLRFDRSPRATAALTALLRAGLDPAAVHARLAVPGRPPAARAQQRLAALRAGRA